MGEWGRQLEKWYLIPSLVGLAVGGVLICVYAHIAVLGGIVLVGAGLYGLHKKEKNG